MMQSETSKMRNELSTFCKGCGLDLGSGGDSIVPRAIAIDLDMPYTKVGNCPINLRGDARHLHWFTDCSMDFVYASHLLEDFENIDEIVMEWRRVLHVGGYLVLYMPDQKRYEAHCVKTGQGMNEHHVHADMSLEYMVKCFERCELDIVWAHDDKLGYSFAIVGKRTKP